MGEERLSKSEMKYKDNGIRMKIGTLDKKRHDVVYIDMATYLTPKENKTSYLDDESNLRISLRKHISNIIKTDGRFCRDFIFNFDISETRIKYGKPTFLTMMTVMRFRKSDNDKFSNIAPALKNTVAKEIVDIVGKEIAETFECQESK